MSSFLIIDGYNLMHEAGLARATYGPGDLSRQRRELLVRLARRLSTDERKRCTVVFDAIDAPANLPARFKHEEMIVLFPPPGHEADELIESLVSQHSAPRRLTVVSSDHRLQTAIRRRRGIGIDSDVFLKQLESPHRQIGPSGAMTSPPRNSAIELDFWLEEFEGVHPETLNQEVLVQSPETKSDWESRIELLQQRIQDADGLDEWLNEPDKTIPSRKLNSEQSGPRKIDDTRNH